MSNKNHETKMQATKVRMVVDWKKPIKKSKSSNNSPRVQLETLKRTKNILNSTREELPQIFRNEGDTEASYSEKIKGLEEIGLFSEFSFSKPINGYFEKSTPKKGTIHITDFMGNENKMNLIRSAGGLEVYSHKKHEFQKEIMLRDINLKKFFNHSEKNPSFFNTPPVSPRFKMNSPPSKLESSTNSTQRVNDIDSIIEKCDQAILLKPPKILTKSISPRILKSDSDQKFKKSKRLIL